MKLPRDLERQILSQADKVGPTPDLPAPEPEKPKRKYRNEPVVVDGIRFDSKREAHQYVALKSLERGGVITGLRLQVPYRLEVNGVLVAKYVADFVYSDGDGETVVADAKGVRTPLFKLKAKLMKAVHGITILEL